MRSGGLCDWVNFTIVTTLLTNNRRTNSAADRPSPSQTWDGPILVSHNISSARRCVFPSDSDDYTLFCSPRPLALVACGLGLGPGAEAYQGVHQIFEGLSAINNSWARESPGGPLRMISIRSCVPGVSFWRHFGAQGGYFGTQHVIFKVPKLISCFIM